MTIVTTTAEISTESDTDIVDITGLVSQHLAQSGIQHGAVTLFVPGSTGALTTIEYESGLIQDLSDAIDRVAPRDIPYAHDRHWGDGNGYAHVRASLLGPSLAVPFAEGQLLLGAWQQIVLIDFDNRPRRRELVVQLSGTRG